MDKEEEAYEIGLAATAGALAGQALGIGVAVLSDNRIPTYEHPVAVEAAQQITQLPDVRNMTPAEVNLEMEKRKAEIEKERDLARDEARGKDSKRVLKGLVLGAMVGGGGAGYAAWRSRRKKEQEENKGAQKG